MKNRIYPLYIPMSNIIFSTRLESKLSNEIFLGIKKN